MRRLQPGIGGTVALLLAAAIWLPLVHLLYRQNPAEYYVEQGIPPKARHLAARHLQLWTEPELRKQELQRMRKSNAEWDFMGRSFLVWSLANMGLREPATKAGYLPVIDQIIEETLRLEEQEGIYFFLMPYAKSRPFTVEPARSLFQDGEIALMLALRWGRDPTVGDQCGRKWFGFGGGGLFQRHELPRLPDEDTRLCGISFEESRSSELMAKQR